MKIDDAAVAKAVAAGDCETLAAMIGHLRAEQRFHGLDFGVDCPSCVGRKDEEDTGVPYYCGDCGCRMGVGSPSARGFVDSPTSASPTTGCMCWRCLVQLYPPNSAFGHQPGPASINLHFPFGCDICGNKRCPHTEWHQFRCTNSNDDDQVGQLDEEE